MYSKTSMKQRVLLKGKDAIDLLHRISSVNLKKSKTSPKMPGLILNPQGKILSFFEIELQSEDQAVVEFEDQFLAILDQYTFGERYEVIKLDPIPENSMEDLDRILAMTPKLGNEFFSNGEVNPLEVNLKTAIHDQKGCYPGQEVIEKIISLGSPAKKLCLLQTTSEATLTLPTPLKDAEGKEAGTLTSFADHYGLAILKRNYLKEGLSLFAGGISFTIQKVSP